MEVLTKVNGILEILMKMDQFDRNQIRGLCGAPEEPVCMGMDEPLNKLKIELMKDGVSVLVLTGLGGSGKTTLAKKLCWEPQIKGKFGENIFFVTISKTPNLKNIVQALFEHCGCRVPEFQTDEDAINRLGLLLRQVGRNPILLVLDDVWPNSEGLVENFKFQMSDYKILVTSRVAFRRFGTPFELDPLDHNHAVSLFHHFAQLNHSSIYMPDLNLVHEIVKGCKGSPLALQLVAGSLCKQPFEKWQNMKERLMSKSIIESNSTDLLCYLQQSLDISEDKGQHGALKLPHTQGSGRGLTIWCIVRNLTLFLHKRLFSGDISEDINEKECSIDMGLFPEDQRIHVPALIDLPAELLNSDEDGREAMATDNDLITGNLINAIATRICAGCNAEIGHGRFLNCMEGDWHPQCFTCHACHLPITDYEFSMSSNRPYHKSCYREKYHPRCDVCKNFIPANSAGLIEYRAHPFWIQKYCPTHELDSTPRCCSCERMEPKDSKYLFLDDGRKLCLECLDSAIMDSHECQPLYHEILEFYEGLNIKVEPQVPILLVERQTIKEAIEGEKNGHYHLPETRGLCLSEEQTVTTILRRPIIGAGYRVTDMITKPYRLTRRCEVTAILVLYGLPRINPSS
ncbi:protein DA1-related 7 isoform X2 [Medicago truncatula]|uniref:protein DA1-related 7 isoform X2 n=1 Tax=Medicago truncatula TaxID=3880 RepID=UPI0019676C7A|nr:protein DA1-related 7 isoform X2 [Medicago truncatula]